MVSKKNKEYFPIERNELWYSQKISELRKHLGLSQAAFAAKLGVSGAAIGQLERGESKSPSADLLGALTSMLSVNLDWLLNGEGEMLKSETIPAEAQKTSAYEPGEFIDTSLPLKGIDLSQVNDSTKYRSPKVLHLQPTVNEEGTPNIGLVNTRVAAGYVQHLAEPEYVRTLPAFSLPDKAYRNGTFRCFVVQGDSMQPTLYAGDWVICRALDNWTRDIRDTFVHVVVTDEQPLVKRVLNRLTDRGELSVLSDNPAYPTQFIDAADVRELWVAVGKISRHFENPRYDVAQELSRTRADVDELIAFMMEMKGQEAAKSPSSKT